MGEEIKSFKNLEIVDVQKKTFFLSSKLFFGAFGGIYTVYDENRVKIQKTIVKIGLQNNMFSERGFYLKYCKNKKSKHILEMITHGTVTVNKEKYIFMFFPKLKNTLQNKLEKITDENLKKKFIYNSMINLIDALEFLHEYGVIHSDIKDNNIMFDKNNILYLIDFNTYQKKSKTLKENYKNFSGSFEFAPVNAHKGIYLEINDLESLLYNGIDWLNYNQNILPWSTNSHQNKAKIKEAHLKIIESKIDFINNINKYTNDEKFLQYCRIIKSVQNDELINNNKFYKTYDCLKTIFLED